MYEIFSRRKSSNVRKTYFYFSIFYFSFLSYRKDEIERLRRDLGHTPRSMVAPQTERPMERRAIASPPAERPMEQRFIVSPKAAKPVAQEDIDYVCIDLFKKSILIFI